MDKVLYILLGNAAPACSKRKLFIVQKAKEFMKNKNLKITAAVAILSTGVIIASRPRFSIQNLQTESIAQAAVKTVKIDNWSYNIPIKPVDATFQEKTDEYELKILNIFGNGTTKMIRIGVKPKNSDYEVVVLKEDEVRIIDLKSQNASLVVCSDKFKDEKINFGCLLIKKNVYNPKNSS